VKLIVDMNLSPAWVSYFEQRGVSARHWSTIGPPGAKDAEIMAFARDDGAIISRPRMTVGPPMCSTSTE